MVHRLPWSAWLRAGVAIALLTTLRQTNPIQFRHLQAHSQPNSSAQIAIASSQPSPKPSHPEAMQTAFDHATSAVSLNHSAYSFNDWYSVTHYWQKSINILKTVPTDSIDYPMAQQKLIEYQRNLAYSKQQVAKYTQKPTATLTKKRQKVASLKLGFTCPSKTAQPGAEPLALTQLKFSPSKSKTRDKYLVGCITNHDQKMVSKISVTYQGTSDQHPDFFQAGFGDLGTLALQPGQTQPFKSRFKLNNKVNKLKISSIYLEPVGDDDIHQISTSITLTR
ncbi:MAG: hypothetical protein F6K19_19590 [Cyanothece sp. SIO1E1]|nr:hypothetical protein [Cyanothece sp. SIO1E1]